MFVANKGDPIPLPAHSVTNPVGVRFCHLASQERNSGSHSAAEAPPLLQSPSDSKGPRSAESHESALQHPPIRGSNRGRGVLVGGPGRR